ncbi:MAG: pyruvate ferredoxin oxidoreductase, partial [Deltaproteobacteria bacterium]|nr:pyruvate ferredoxin oxidoreductase [Deltaproteobacteria bacterium]
MLKQVEGSHAVAEAVAMCRPEVISAYPTTPQTHLFEDLGMMVKTFAIDNGEFMLVESEFVV